MPQRFFIGPGHSCGGKIATGGVKFCLRGFSSLGLTLRRDTHASETDCKPIPYSKHRSHSQRERSIRSCYRSLVHPWYTRGREHSICSPQPRAGAGAAREPVRPIVPSRSETESPFKPLHARDAPKLGFCTTHTAAAAARPTRARQPRSIFLCHAAPCGGRGGRGWYTACERGGLLPMPLPMRGPHAL